MTLTAGQPDEFLATQALAGTQLFSGEYRKAAATTQRAYDQAGVAKAPDVQANALLTNAASRGFAGLCEGNEQAVQRALALDKSRQTQSFALLTAGICGNSKLVGSMAQDLSQKFPDDTLIQRVFIPLAKAFVALSRASRGRRSMMQSRPRRFPGLSGSLFYRAWPICSCMTQTRLRMPFALRPSLRVAICKRPRPSMPRRSWV